MNENEKLLDIKVKVMLQRIERLSNSLKMVLKKDDAVEIKSLELIKNKYIQMYNKIIERKEYEKYNYLEDLIIKKISKIELQLDEYVLNNPHRYEEILKEMARNIRNSANYQNYQNLEEELNRVKSLKELLKLYEPYLSKGEEEEIKNEISHLKFDLLYRKQVEELIYNNGGTNSNLGLYENEQEKEVFEKMLQDKINEIISTLEDETIKSDELFNIPSYKILNDSNLLERLIILDMKAHPLDFINLVKAKMFNAHLCNIGNNPFEQKIYLTEEQIIYELGYSRYKDFLLYSESFDKGLKANKINYSLLEAILKNIITDENLSIIECENLYKRFGFKCRPILTNIGQRCVYMIFSEVDKSVELENIKKKLEKDKQKKEGKYCKIDFKGLKYRFSEEKKSQIDDILGQTLDEREILAQQEPEIKKRKFPFWSQKECKQQTLEQGDLLQRKKDKVKEMGFIPTDLNLIVLLAKDVINKYNKEYYDEAIKELNMEQEKEVTNDISAQIEYYNKKRIVEYFEKEIKEENTKIEWIESLKNKRLTTEEMRQLLLIIFKIYNVLNIKYDVRELIPLEDMISISDRFVSIPENMEVHYDEYSGYPSRKHKSDLKPLWKKYQKDCIDLGIDVKKYDDCYEGSRKGWDSCVPEFEICINLDDISDLPIDYNKVKLLTKDELQEIIEREEGNERE